MELKWKINFNNIHQNTKTKMMKNTSNDKLNETVVPATESKICTPIGEKAKIIFVQLGG